MIIVDTSAIVAIALREAEAEALQARIETDGAARLSAASYVEASNVLEGRLGAAGRVVFENVLRRLALQGLAVVAVDANTAEHAREGFRRYGKGRHPAGLNFGDCFAYGLAKALDAPLLYKGGDFDKTDLKRA